MDKGLNLKNNFLKELIFRLDYSGLLDMDVEKKITDLKNNLYNRGYTTLKEKIEQDISVNVNMFNGVDNKTEVKNTTVYEFSSPNNKVFKISKNYIIFDIDISANETTFEHYIDLITSVICKLSEERFVKFHRIGLRKTNICLIKEGTDLKEYINPSILSIFDDDFQEIQNSSKLFKNEFQVQYTASLVKGTITNNDMLEPWNQYLLDIDVFKEAEEFDKSKVDKSYLKIMNSLIFDIYTQSLSDNFIRKLSEEEFKDEDILGVNKNV